MCSSRWGLPERADAQRVTPRTVAVPSFSPAVNAWVANASFSAPAAAAVRLAPTFATSTLLYGALIGKPWFRP